MLMTPFRSPNYKSKQKRADNERIMIPAPQVKGLIVDITSLTALLLQVVRQAHLDSGLETVPAQSREQ